VDAHLSHPVTELLLAGNETPYLEISPNSFDYNELFAEPDELSALGKATLPINISA
jgi:hypothetical protein